MVKQVNEIFKCNVCGNLVEVLFVGGKALVCCGEDMVLLVGNTVDASVEKHVPVVTAIDGGIHVVVGSVPHPMLEAHYITLIEVLTKTGLVLRQDLKPGDAPEASFTVNIDDVEVVREYCNLHGLWVAK